MPRSKPWRINGLFLLLATVGILFGSAGPAAASHLAAQGGSTDGLGYEVGPAFDEICGANNQIVGLQFETTYYLITHQTAHYVVRDNGLPVAYYSGPVSMNIQHGDMVWGLQGAAPDECTGQFLVPAAIPLTKATVLGSSAAGSVSCQMLTPNGSYLRVATDVTITFDLWCTVSGNTSGLTGTRSLTISHTVTGTQVPCFQMPGGCENGSARSQLTTAFTITGSGH